ncbi:hypothetical protein, partial [Agrococcus versicolor]
MADDETTDGSGTHGSDGAGGSASGSTATGDMGLEALLALVTGVEDSRVATVLTQLEDGRTGWITGTPGGDDRDAWSPNMRYGYYHYKDNVRSYELINNPEPMQQFGDSMGALGRNVARVTSDSMPGLSARRAETASALFATFTQVTATNAQDISALATALGADDSSIRGSAAAALLAQLTAQQKSLEAMHRQLTDDGGVAPRLQVVADAVRTFMASVGSTWDAHRAEIGNRASQARSAVMEDIVRYIEEADQAWRAGGRGRNGMTVEHAKGVYAAYTFADRAGMAPAGFGGVGGDLHSQSTYGTINRAISQTVRDAMATAAAEVFAAQQTLETAMRSSLRTFKGMQDPTALVEDTSADYAGGGGVGGDGVGGDGPGGGGDFDFGGGGGDGAGGDVGGGGGGAGGEFGGGGAGDLGGGGGDGGGAGDLGGGAGDLGGGGAGGFGGGDGVGGDVGGGAGGDPAGGGAGVGGDAGAVGDFAGGAGAVGGGDAGVGFGGGGALGGGGAGGDLGGGGAAGDFGGGGGAGSLG